MWIQMPKSTKESRLKRLQLNPNLDGNWGRQLHSKGYKYAYAISNCNQIHFQYEDKQ